MKRVVTATVLLLLLVLLPGCKSDPTTNVLEIIQTTDVHGNFFSQDLLTGSPSIGGYSRVQTYVAEHRRRGEQVLLLDAGDLLQGQPGAYFYNYVDTTAPHVAMQILNYMQYDALTVGNHDFETGHPVYDRIVREADFPFLAANVIRVKSDEDTVSMEPYFQPYTMVEKGDKRIAILGLTMPTLVHQLPKVLWSGIRFDDQIETAKRYMPEILDAHPDLIIALIHSGAGRKEETSPRSYAENVGYALARAVPDLDLIFCGHDHRSYLDSIVHDGSHTTYILNPGANGAALAHVTVDFTAGAKALRPEIVPLDTVQPQPLFVQNFTPHLNRVRDYVEQHVGTLTAPLDSRSAFFRPTPFVDLIHEVQMEVFPDAQISITAPLAENTRIPAGELLVRDLFHLYKYENRVYLMRLSGEEIRGHLEESYDRIYHTMSALDAPMLRLDDEKRRGIYLPLAGPSFNFDTAAGIDYTVDLSKPRGKRVKITALSDGTPFSQSENYLVVLNSYRGNGGGGLLTKGAGIPADSIANRRVDVSEQDLRYYLRRFLLKNDPYTPRTISRWTLVPAKWMEVAIPRDSVLLYQDFQ